MEHDREERNQRNLNYLGDDEVPVDELVEDGVLEELVVAELVLEGVLELVLDGLVVDDEDREDVELDDRRLDEEELFFLQKRSDVASPVAVKHATNWGSLQPAFIHFLSGGFPFPATCVRVIVGPLIVFFGFGLIVSSCGHSAAH